MTFSQDSFEKAPINYSKRQPNDPIHELQKAIAEKPDLFEFDEQHGFLKSLLKELNISTTSQLLVYSKTSLQLHRISPHTPRAIYFNDDVYIGFIPGSDRLEVSTADPDLGGVFYLLEQKSDAPPKFIRDEGNCLTCHATSRTQGVPGHLMRSVYAAPSGQPHYGMGTYLTTHESPFEKRFGGWYATGKHGSMKHMANQITRRRNDEVDWKAGANVVDLSDRFRTSRYLTPHSDWVALMTLAHQAEMHNLITAANFQTREAVHHGKVMNKALERPDDFISDSTKSRIDRSVDKLVRYMLFVDEQEFDSPIEGTSGFRKYFEALGPFDKKGRSLRQFDLKQRTFKYRCSYLIYTDSFKSLPEMAKERIYKRLWDVLTGKDESKDFKKLTADERQAIREILIDTLDDLPDYWKK